MTSSANYDQFRDHTALWETKLIDLDHYLRNLNEVQRKYVLTGEVIRELD